MTDKIEYDAYHDEWNSSAVDFFAYNTKTKVLYVTLLSGDNVYAYPGVDAKVFNAFVAADSKGTFYAKNIKPVYKSSATYDDTEVVWEKIEPFYGKSVPTDDRPVLTTVTNVYTLASISEVKPEEVTLTAKSKVTFDLAGVEYTYDSNAYNSDDAIAEVAKVSDILDTILTIKKVVIEFE